MPRMNRTATPARTGTTIQAEGSPRLMAWAGAGVNSICVAEAVSPKNATVTRTIRTAAAA